MKLLFAVCIAQVLLSFPAHSQSPQLNDLNATEQEIMRVVIDVFDGMRAGDSAAVRKHFYPVTSSYSAYTTKAGIKELKPGDIQNWFNAIAKPHDQIWDERIWDYEVQVDGNLSAVWVKYAFYLDQTLHHCGVDAIQLAHNGDSWKIFHIADTRQVNGCEIPAHIADGATY
jgi:hypothetical protein